MARVKDKELELYRGLLEPATEFKDGFGWTTVIGILFCGFVMMPGGIYLGLMTGGNIGSAASWVTVILFMEIARRALKPMSKQHLVVLLHAAAVMMAANLVMPGGPMGWMVYRAYLVGSDAVRDAGMMGAFPSWFSPPADSPAILERTFFHSDWLIPLGLVAFTMVTGFLSKYTLGYIFFRLTSDVEQLPFPLAPIDAQGALALAEADEKPEASKKEEADEDKEGARPKNMRWRIFSIGATLGTLFGLVQVGIPAITGLFLTKPFFLIPQPFVDTTVLSEGLFPATPTGVTLDLGIILVGFVLPFWSVIGTCVAMMLTVVLNPVLHYFGILHTWQPGMDTINTSFSNGMDFWLSFGIGMGLGITAVSLFATGKEVRSKWKALKVDRARREKNANIWALPREGRGDCPLWIAAGIYCLASASLVAVCYMILPKSASLLFFLVLFAFGFVPLLTYINARLLGISGQVLEIPFVRESVFFLSGAKGIEVWLAPIPVDNYGVQVQNFRVYELTGVRFSSMIKTELVALPILFVLSLFYWSFIWHSDAIPSQAFPAAQVNWELMSKNQVLLYSSTFVRPDEDPDEKSIMDSEFMRKAFHPKAIATGFVGTVVLYALLSAFGLPVMLVYGMIRGFGQLPHYMILELVGAMLGRLYFQKKYGQTPFLQHAPALVAGYFTGVGQVAMVTIALRLIKSAISAAPF
jgi:hypothetical protein